MIQELLKQLNFTDKEIAIYLSIIKQGKTTPADIAKLTQINRTTVYSVKDELIKRGVIFEDLGGAVAYVEAYPPEKLHELIELQQKQIEQQKLIVNDAIRELNGLRKNTRYSIPKIRFIDHDSIEKHLYKYSIGWNESARAIDNIWWGFQDHTFVEQFEEWLIWFWNNSPKTTQVNLLSNQSQIEKTTVLKNVSNRNIRFWNGSEDFTATTWVIGDYVVMIITRQKPYYLVEMKDAVYADNLRKIFKNVWQQTE